MTRVFRATLLTACALLSLSAAVAQEYTLKLNVKEGDTFKYRSSMDIDFGGQSVLATVTITLKVLKVEENGNIQMESASGETVIKFGDQEMPQPAPPATKMTLKPNGSAVKADGGDGVMQQMNPAQMVYSEKPIKVGDKWSETVKNAVGELKIDYEFVGVEKVGDTETVKINPTCHLVKFSLVCGYNPPTHTEVNHAGQNHRNLLHPRRLAPHTPPSQRPTSQNHRP